MFSNTHTRLLYMAVGIASAVIMTGCSAQKSGTDASKKVTVNEYTAESGMFSVSLPGEWNAESTSGMKDMLNLSGENGMDAVVMGMAKDNLLGFLAEDVRDLDGFHDYIVKLFMNGPDTTSELKDTQPVEIPGMLKVKAQEGAMIQTSNKARAPIFLECAETENAYYFIMIGINRGYDKKIIEIKENLGLKELEVVVPGADIPETVRWFNATYALLTAINGGNTNIPGGFEASEVMEQTMKEMLARDWNVSDRTSADEMFQWAMTEGHNQEAENVYGENGIKAWDYSRAMSLLGYYYIAGFYTYEEAMDKSLEAAQEIQNMYKSWDEFVYSYLLGYQYWSEDDPTDPNSQYAKRRDFYEELKLQENGPFSIDWNLTLKKEW